MSKSFIGAKGISELDELINVDDLAGLSTLINIEAAPDGTVIALAAMTISPETTPETGYITITISGTDYQIPIYAA